MSVMTNCRLLPILTLQIFEKILRGVQPDSLVFSVSVRVQSKLTGDKAYLKFWRRLSTQDKILSLVIDLEGSYKKPKVL